MHRNGKNFTLYLHGAEGGPILTQKDVFTMDIPRKLGILIYTAVPAIVGGGIVYHFFGSFVQVIIFEMLLVLAVLGLISS